MIVGRRVVVARRWTGIGDCIVSLLAAHRFAKATGRELVVDWRHSTYAPPDRNLFQLVFTAPADWDGVATSCVDPGRGVAVRGPFWPHGWTADALDRPPIDGERGDTREAIARIVAGVDVAEPAVVFDGCIAPAVPDDTSCRRRLSALRVRDDVQRAVRTFVDDRFAARPVVGIHARHGNGGDVMDHASHWARPGAGLLAIADAARAAALALHADCGVEPVVFLATDSQEVETTLGRMLRNVVTRPKAFRPPGAGELHRWPHAHEGLHDALVEMLLLAEVDRLVRYPPGSYFSFWGAVMNRSAAATRTR